MASRDPHTVVELVARATVAAREGGDLDVSVRLLARLDDGREIALLVDRGLSSSCAGGAAVPDVQDVLRDAAVVVGPDEPAGGRTLDEEAASHWSGLAAALAAAGVELDGAALSRVPFRVVLGEHERRWPDGYPASRCAHSGQSPCSTTSWSRTR